MKILVTGANGFLGRGVVKALLDRGAEVVAAGRRLDRVDERAERVECDIFAPEDPYTCFGRPDALLHMAWRDGFVHWSDAHIDDLPSHAAFIRAFAASPVEKIAVMGSMHEIGYHEGCVDENTPCDPATPYGVAKNALRQLTQAYCAQNGRRFQWLRGYYIVSADIRGASVFSKIAAAEAEGRAEFPFTSGQNRYDFLDYDEFCASTARAVMQNEILGIINVCSGRPEKLADRAERFLRENGYTIKLRYGAYPDRPYDSRAIWGDSAKIAAIMSAG